MKTLSELSVASPATVPVDPAAARLRALLSGPVLPTMLRLALPTVVVLFVQTFVSVAETYFVSLLGTDVLAGVTLVFPVLLLMTTMSNGGVGGGVSSAVARALGAGRRADANRLVLHALVLAVGSGLLFTLGVLGGGQALYHALGGTGKSLDAAALYSGVIFAGAVPIWAVNLLASALRGAGNVKVPALIILGGAILLVPLSPALIFGLGPLPGLGVAGAGVAVVLYYVVALGVLVQYLRGGSGGLKLGWAPLERRFFGEIMRVGGLSAVGTAQANLTLILVTGAVGRFGTQALAGYGLAARLDALLVPLLFGLGTAALTLVGANIGANQIARATRAAWTGGLVAAGFSEVIGLAAAVFPHGWLKLFSQESGVLAAGSLYLRIVAPCYGFFGLGLLLYFASQGAGRVGWPFAVGTVRLAVAAGGGWLAVNYFGAGLGGLFAAVAVSSVLFGVLNAVGVWRWERGRGHH